MANLTVLAIDLGAETGRVLAVHFDGGSLRSEEVHRFPNIPVKVRGTLHWDILRLWSEIQAGIRKGKVHNPVSLGVDTWGVDYGLLDAKGELLGNPVHYRDSRTDGMMEYVFQQVPRKRIFMQTGIQFMAINTLYQIASMVEAGSEQLAISDSFLTIPDLINYWLTGVRVCEFTNATTTQMLNPGKITWATQILEKLDIPTPILPEIIQPGTKLGEFDGIKVIAPACHDTGSAVAGVPTRIERYAYISSGTWSLVGQELKEPIINDAALAANITNEGGVANRFRLLKNVMGLWILQQCRATWGAKDTYAELIKMAELTPPYQSIIDVDNTAFLPPGDHPALIQEMCLASNQPVPKAKGEVVRCVLESLALKYRSVLDTLVSLSGIPVDMIHIVGGGSQNEMLNQLTANATARSVSAGPVEATVYGNALIQLITLNEIDNISDGRRLLSNSIDLKHYEPQNIDLWDEIYHRYKGL